MVSGCHIVDWLMLRCAFHDGEAALAVGAIFLLAVLFTAGLLAFIHWSVERRCRARAANDIWLRVGERDEFYPGASCTLRRGHSGMHRDPSGAKWEITDPEKFAKYVAQQAGVLTPPERPSDAEATR